MREETSKSVKIDGKLFEVVTPGTWKRFDEAIDHLSFFCNGLNVGTNNLEKYRRWLIQMRIEDDDILEELADKLYEYSQKDNKLQSETNILVNEIVDMFLEKVNWNPQKKIKNPGYAGYQDMRLRYLDIYYKLNHLEPMLKSNPQINGDLEREWRMMSQMKEKVDELKYRCNLVDVAATVSSRAENNDPLEGLFSLPVFLVGIIFHPSTSTSFASKLLRLCKRCLVVAEAVQYERDQTSHPIVTMSGILKQPPQKKSVPSLYTLVQESTSSSSSSAIPSTQESASCLVVPANGEVGAPPTESSVPIAKDSSITLNSNEDLVSLSKSTRDEKK